MADDRVETEVIRGRDGHHIHVRIHRLEGEARGVVQILHGLGEHARRYDRFAAAAAERGLAVVIHDHRGHGGHSEQAGYFSDHRGWHCLVEDAHAVNVLIKERFPDRPITLLGHSMGSFVAQSFAMVFGDRIDAMILSASTWPSRIEVGAGNLLARLEVWRVGPRRESALLDKLGFGGYNRAFAPVRTEHDWLSRDEAEVDAYVDDPLCGGPFTTGLWRDLTGGLMMLGSDDNLLRIPSDLPILITGGSVDPVGGEKKLGQLALHYAQTHHGRMKVKIYPDGRHEMLNETNRDEVTADWLDWIEANTRS